MGRLAQKLQNARGWRRHALHDGHCEAVGGPGRVGKHVGDLTGQHGVGEGVEQGALLKDVVPQPNHALLRQRRHLAVDGVPIYHVKVDRQRKAQLCHDALEPGKDPLGVGRVEDGYEAQGPASHGAERAKALPAGQLIRGLKHLADEVCDCEGGALPERRGHFNGAVHAVCDPLADAEPQALCLAGPPVVFLGHEVA
eukprot:scaffold429087_cov40-Prasinocladus_malaysianus.AAC.2